MKTIDDTSRMWESLIKDALGLHTPEDIRQFRAALKADEDDRILQEHKKLMAERKAKYEFFLQHRNSTFEFWILYKTTNPDKFDVDNFQVDGWDNMEMIYEAYRSIGFSAKVHKLEICVDDKCYKTLTFKYR